METESPTMSPDAIPHASNHVDQMIAAQLDQKSAEDRFGDMIDRSFGMSGEPNGKQSPRSDGEPYGFSDPLDAEEAPTEEETLDEKLDRVFAEKPAPKPPVVERKNPEPSQPEQETAPDEPLSSNLFSWEDVQRAQQFAAARQQLMEAVHRHQQDAQLIEQIEDPQRKAAALEWHNRRDRELLATAEALDRVNGELHKAAEDRLTARAEQRVASERQKLQKAFPDLDVPKLRGFLLEQGYTEQDLHGARASDLIIAEQARRYREMQKQTKPKVVRRVTPKTDDRAKLRRAERSGNYDGIEGALERRLGEIFR